MKYSDILADGEMAFEFGKSRNDNPHLYQSVAWYAWDNGWTAARAEARKLEMTHEQDVAQDAGTVLVWEHLTNADALAFTTGASDCVWIVPGTYSED